MKIAIQNNPYNQFNSSFNARDRKLKDLENSEKLDLFDKHIKRKYYPTNITKAAIEQIDGIPRDANQRSAHDCYLVSFLHALANSDEGKDFIKDNFKKTKTGFVLNFPGAPDKKQSVFVSKNEINCIDENHEKSLWNSAVLSNDPNTRVWELGTRKVMKKAKSDLFKFIIKLYISVVHTENRLIKDKLKNDPLNYYNAQKSIGYMTGKEPTALSNISISSIARSKSKIKRAEALLKKIDESKNNAFITNTLINKDRDQFTSFHYYSIKDVNSKKRELTLVDPHKGSEDITVDYDTYFDNFTNIVGCFLDKKEN